MTAPQDSQDEISKRWKAERQAELERWNAGTDSPVGPTVWLVLGIAATIILVIIWLMYTFLTGDTR